jgi:dTDP-4-amino-4,6-dideoxygalactose transaminase
LILGESVSTFEIEFARYIGAPYSVGVGNGLDGLILALKALGIKPGDYVAVPAHTFIATWIAVISTGGIPMSIDVDEFGLMNLDALTANSVIPKYVIPVHMHGRMVDMPRLMKWAKIHDVKVVEDASQAHGASLRKIKAGAFGDLGVFSLYPTKNLGAIGDAGVVTCFSQKIYEELMLLRNYGASSSDKYRHTRLGLNSRLDSIQAACLRIGLSKLDEWNNRRRKLASIYNEKLSALPVNILNSDLDSSIFHHYVILTPKRDLLRAYLSAHNIGTEIHYPVPADFEMQNLGFFTGKISINAEKISNTSLSVPLTQWHTEDQINIVCEIINNFFLAECKK